VGGGSRVRRIYLCTTVVYRHGDEYNIPSTMSEGSSESLNKKYIHTPTDNIISNSTSHSKCISIV